MNTIQNPQLHKHIVICGFCRDCKYMVRDKVYEQVLLCDNENLKLGIVFSHEGGQLSVDEDFGCVQFEKRLITSPRLAKKRI